MGMTIVYTCIEISKYKRKEELNYKHAPRFS